MVALHDPTHPPHPPQPHASEPLWQMPLRSPQIRVRGGMHTDWTLHEVRIQYRTYQSMQRVTGHLIRASKPRKEPSHKEISIMINSVMKYKEPQINTDERRFVDLATMFIDNNEKTMKKSIKIDINNEQTRTRTNSGSMSSCQFVPVRCLYGAVFHTRSQRAQSVHRDH